MIAKTNEEFIKEIEKKFPNQVSYEKTNYKGAFTPVILTCPIHGDIHAIPHNILKKSSVMACPKCGTELGRKHANHTRGNSKEQFLERLYKRFPNIKYDFSEAKYVDSHKHIKVICHEKDCDGVEHGAWMIKPGNLYTGYGCPKCANEKNSITYRPVYDDYCQSIKEKYGDIYVVDKESYFNTPFKIKIWCNKHNKYFITDTRSFPRYNNHKCPDCIKEEIEIHKSTNNNYVEKELNHYNEDVINFEEETWVDVRGYEGKYQCSSEGRFKRINRTNRVGKKIDDYIIKPSFFHHLPTISLSGKTYILHRKLYESFHNMDLPKGYSATIDHIDNDVKNNKISNLRFGGTPRENILNNKLTVARLSARRVGKGIKQITNIDDLPGEKWADVIGYEDCYEVSNFGRVVAKERTLIEKNTNIKRVKKRHLMRQAIKYGQYYTVGLTNYSGNHKTHYTHRLVYESFNGRIKEGNQVDHIDSNSLNNNLENLREVTPLENVRNPNSQFKRKKNRKEHHSGLYVEKVDLKGNTIESYESIVKAAKLNSISFATMQKWVSGKVDQEKNRSKGFYFKKNNNIKS